MLNFGNSTIIDSEYDSDSLLEFVSALGLEEEVRSARKELGAVVRESSGAWTLKALRLEAGLSQKELADITGTTQPRISALEGGREGMGLAFARKMARALRVDLDTIASVAETTQQDAHPRV